MTIIEINNTLCKMSVGSKAHFIRYMTGMGMFKNEKQAKEIVSVEYCCNIESYRIFRQ